MKRFKKVSMVISAHLPLLINMNKPSEEFYVKSYFFYSVKRPHSIPVNGYKCVVCQVLEDECHFILECQMYTELRRKYIPRYYWHRPIIFKFVEQINTSNTRRLKNLGAYVYQAFKTRTEQWYWSGKIIYCKLFEIFWLSCSFLIL